MLTLTVTPTALVTLPESTATRRSRSYQRMRALVSPGFVETAEHHTRQEAVATFRHANDGRRSTLVILSTILCSNITH